MRVLIKAIRQVSSPATTGLSSPVTKQLASPIKRFNSTAGAPWSESPAAKARTKKPVAASTPAPDAKPAVTAKPVKKALKPATFPEANPASKVKAVRKTTSLKLDSTPKLKRAIIVKSPESTPIPEASPDAKLAAEEGRLKREHESKISADRIAADLSIALSNQKGSLKSARIGAFVGIAAILASVLIVKWCEDQHQKTKDGHQETKDTLAARDKELSELKESDLTVLITLALTNEEVKCYKDLELRIRQLLAVNCPKISREYETQRREKLDRLAGDMEMERRALLIKNATDKHTSAADETEAASRLSMRPLA